jgi:hypothetical protein
MSESDSAIMEHLIAIRTVLDVQTTRVLELIKRFGNLEGQVAGISKGLNRIDGRLDRIEGRLGLIEARI